MGVLTSGPSGSMRTMSRVVGGSAGTPCDHMWPMPWISQRSASTQPLPSRYVSIEYVWPPGTAPVVVSAALRGMLPLLEPSSAQSSIARNCWTMILLASYAHWPAISGGKNATAAKHVSPLYSHPA